MGSGFAAIGTQLKSGNGASPEVFTTVAKIKSIDWSGRKLDLDDTTNMDSTNFYEEVLPTIFRSGEVSFDMLYVPGDTSQTNFEADYTARTLRNWKWVFPNDPSTSPVVTYGTWAFQGYITELGIKAETTKAVTRNCKIKVTGAPTWIYHG